MTQHKEKTDTPAHLADRQFDAHTPFGPIIMKSVISDQLHRILLQRADQIRQGTHPNQSINTRTNDFRPNTVSGQAEVYSYDNAFSDDEDKVVVEELTWLVSKFTELAAQENKSDQNQVRQAKDIILMRPVWVNYMKQGEWNPAHYHVGKFSCVIYLKVPEEIEKENEIGEHTKTCRVRSAGRIEFLFGDAHMPFNTNMFMRVPRAKDIYIFPAYLTHVVYPFKAETERVSVSVNFADKVDLLADLVSGNEKKQAEWKD